MIMDRGFFVLKGLIDMYERGVYGISVANKHIYWPAEIYEDQIDYY